jgi:hypothetical protein
MERRNVGSSQLFAIGKYRDGRLARPAARKFRAALLLAREVDNHTIPRVASNRMYRYSQTI